MDGVAMKRWRQAAIFSLLVVLPLITLASLWALFNGRTYPEGLAMRMLVTGSFLFVVLTVATAWQTRRKS